MQKEDILTTYSLPPTSPFSLLYPERGKETREKSQQREIFHRTRNCGFGLI
jgi:hypothetical protein